MKRIRIVNWAQLQHYKDRNPPRIKLYNSLLDDYRFRCLQDAIKLLYILLLLLRCRQTDDIPADPEYIKSVTSFRGEIDLQPLIDAGFIECYQDDSGMIAPCKHDAMLEREKRQRREETEKEGEQTPNRKRFVPPSPDEVTEYGKSIDYQIDGQQFCDFYASKGWKVGNSPMKDWRAAVRTWKRNDFTDGNGRDGGIRREIGTRELTEEEAMDLMKRHNPP